MPHPTIWHVGLLHLDPDDRVPNVGRAAEFVRHLEALRVKYKIKRNFIKLVEQKRKSLYL